MFGTSEKLFVDSWNRTVLAVPEMNKLTLATGNSVWTDVASTEEKKKFTFFSFFFLTSWKNVDTDFLFLTKRQLSLAMRFTEVVQLRWEIRDKFYFSHMLTLIQVLSISTPYVGRKLFTRKIKLRPSAFFQSWSFLWACWSNELCKKNQQNWFTIFEW